MERLDKKFQQKAKREFKRSDPTQSSRVLSSGENLWSIGERNDKERPIKRKGLGEKYHTIEQRPELQQFVSRILKPFLNVSDIVKDKNGIWYSYEPSIQSIEGTSDAARVNAEQDILKYVFGDIDHLALPRGWGKTSNVTRKNDRHMFYDFAAAQSFYTRKHISADSYKSTLERRSRPEEVECARDLIARMLMYYENSEGKAQVLAAFKATGKKINELFEVPTKAEISFEEFYETFLGRLRTMRDVLAELSASSGPANE